MGEYKFYCPDITKFPNNVPGFLNFTLEEPRKVRGEITPYISKLIYQYPDEEEEIIYPESGGELTYELNSPVEITCDNHRYRIHIQIENAIYPGSKRRNYSTGNIGYECQYYSKTSSRVVWGEILGFRYADYRLLDDDCVGYDSPNHAPSNVIYDGHQTFQVLCYGTGYVPTSEPVWVTMAGDGNGLGIVTVLLNDDVFSYSIEAVDDPCYGCEFKVFEDGELIFERKEEVCPIVDVYNCDLDEERKTHFSYDLNPGDIFILIEGKTGFLNPFIETLLAATGALRKAFLFNPSLLSQISNQGIGNPPECILLLRMNDFTTLDILAQFCSTTGCPPPLYEVICDGLKCPDNTCEVECDDHICCYTSEGKVIKVIPKN